MSRETPARYLKGEARTAAVARARELYESGSTIRAVAQQMGRSYGSVRELLLEAGAILRPPSRRPAQAALVTPEAADRLRAMQAIARTVNGSTALDDPARATSVELTVALQAFVVQGVSAGYLDQVLGLQGGAVRKRLARHGYVKPPPSLADRRYRARTTRVVR